MTEISPVDHVVADDDDCLAAMIVEESREDRLHALQNVGVGFAAEIGGGAGILDERAVGIGKFALDTAPVFAFPLADVALCQLIDLLDREIVMSGDGRGGLAGALQAA